METVYITGHRNPDLDSICSAISYAALKNLIDPKNKYIPIRCSHIGESMKTLLKTLDIKPPRFKGDAFPKVRDVMISECENFDLSMTVTEFAKICKKDNPLASPVFDNGKYFGLISIDDIANWAIDQLNNKEKLVDNPKLKDIIREQEPPLNENDLFSVGKSKLLNSNKRGLAVFDENDAFVGYVTRRCFLNTPKHNIILVDHNESEQSIKGIDSANILEIIDHHRLNAIKTDLPLFIYAEPLGSTCTLIYQLYIRNGIRPTPQIAKTMLAGLISDTLILKSPTTSKTDIEAAYMLATICDEDVNDFGNRMFSNVKGLKSRNAEDAITSDFKIYNQSKYKIGIGQCEVTTLLDLEEYVEEYTEALEKVRVKNGLDWTLLMITDVLKERSILLSTKFRAEKELPYSNIKEHIFDMPGVMSRKKQLLPEVLHVIDI